MRRILFLAGFIFATTFCSASDEAMARAHPAYRIGFDQRIDAQLPMSIQFSDEGGNAVALRDVTRGQVFVLAPVYFDCPMLCTLTLNGLLRCLRVLNLTAGRDFQVVVFSINPNENAALALKKKTNYVRGYGRAGTEAGWHFLTGTRASIDALTQAIGFRYVADNDGKEFAHAPGFVIATADGKISRVFLGIEYPPKDVKLALLEAAQGRMGSVVDQVLLYCHRYDPSTGRYSVAIMKMIRIGGGATALILFGAIAFLLKNERKGGAAAHARSV